MLASEKDPNEEVSLGLYSKKYI